MFQSLSRSLGPDLLLCLEDVEGGEGELEVGPEVLVDVDVTGGGHRYGRDGGMGAVHVEGDHSCGEVYQSVLSDQLSPLVHSQLHVEVAGPEVRHHQPEVPVPAEV